MKEQIRLGPQESTARALVHQICSTGARQVLLCGDSPLALAVLLELAHRAWEAGELIKAAADGVAAAKGVAADGGVAAAEAAWPLIRLSSRWPKLPSG